MSVVERAGVVLSGSASAVSAHPLVPRFPWPLPCALGIVAGCLAAQVGVPFVAVALFAAALVVPLRFVLLRSQTSGTRVSWNVPISPAGIVLLVLPLALSGVGYLRYQGWLEQPNPLHSAVGQPGEYSGESDGDTIVLDSPEGARVAIAPRGSVPTGRVTVRGELLEPDGKRNPGGFDYRDYLLRRGVHGQLRVDDVLTVEPVLTLRDRFAVGAQAGLSPERAALMKALTLGIRDELGDLRDSFSAAGIAHVLALSGLHVGILAAAVGWLASPLRIYRYPLLLLFDVGFVLVVGASPSVVRAGLMLAAVLLALWLGAGKPEPWQVLSLSALIALLFQPQWLFDLSFQLSYGAVAGILLFTPPVLGLVTAGGSLPWWSPRSLLVVSAATSLAAQALTLPLVAGTFNVVPLLSPVVNVIAIPLATVLVPLGFVASVVGLVSVELAGWVNQLTGPLAGLLIGVAQLGAELPLLEWNEIPLSGAFLYLVALAAAALALHRLLRPRRAALVVLSALTASVALGSSQPPAELVVLDVGQGDAILLRLPGRVEILVDAGGSPFSDFDVGSKIVVPALRAMGVDELELVVATHADADHMEGLSAVLAAMPVQTVIYGHGEPEKPIFTALVAAAREQGADLLPVRRGHVITLPGARIEVLNPPQLPLAASNDNSVAMRVTITGGSTVLMLGDISSQVEEQLAPLAADILVAAHHGSRSSTSPRLLRAAAPELVIISVGTNGYGHPHPDVLERVKSAGIQLLTTMEAGAVRVPLHGGSARESR